MAIALMALISPLSAATLDEERQQLIDLKNKVAQLTAVNQDIELNIADVTKQLAAVVTDSEAAQALEEAKAAALAAEQSSTVDPTADNKSKWENAEFKLKLAQRKYDKANQEPTRLKKERADLSEALASNQRQISYLNARIVDQQELLDRLNVEHQAATENSLVVQQEQLKQEQQERAAAQQEIDELKTLLAQKEAAEAESLRQQEADAIAKAAAAEKLERERIVAEQVAAAEAAEGSPAAVLPPNTLEPASEGIIVLTDASQVNAELARSKLQISKDGGVSKVNKILHMKSYKFRNLLERSSHSMKSLSTTQFQGQIEMRAGRTEFVVGSHSWWLDVTESADGVSYSALLDISNPDQERLVIFPGSLAN